MSDPQVIGNYDYRGTNVGFYVGPIDKIEGSVVVVSSDDRLTMNFGAAHALLVAGGPEFSEALYAAKLFYTSGPLSIDCSMVDSLQFRKVLVIPLKHRNRHSMRTVYREALKIMIDSGETVGVMPLIGCGGYNLPISVACREMCEAISSFTNLRQISQLKFVDISRRTMEQLYHACADLGNIRIPDVVSPYQLPFMNNVYGNTFNGMSMLQPQFQSFHTMPPSLSFNDSDVQILASSNQNPSSTPSTSEVVFLNGNIPSPLQLPDSEILYVGVTTPRIDPDEVMSNTVLAKIYTEVDRNTITEKESSCSICLNELAISGGEGFEDKLEEDPVVQMKLCIHQFHRSCINKCLNIKKQCPLCMKWYTSFGTQPKDAKMRVKRIPGNPPGHGNADGWFKITYTIPSGIQGPNHIRPGQPYTGTTRSAYIPNDTEGRLVLQLLKKAFEYRHTFTIGDSVTTGRNNVPVMVIHHKTNMTGGPANYGYPDPSYYGRVRNELEQLGITPAMLDN